MEDCSGHLPLVVQHICHQPTWKRKCYYYYKQKIYTIKINNSTNINNYRSTHWTQERSRHMPMKSTHWTQERPRHMPMKSTHWTQERPQHMPMKSTNWTQERLRHMPMKSTNWTQERLRHMPMKIQVHSWLGTNVL